MSTAQVELPTISQAIRQGMPQCKQAFGAFFEPWIYAGETEWRACVLGTALVGIYGIEGVSKDKLNFETQLEILALWPELDTRRLTQDELPDAVPVGMTDPTLFEVIVELNDNARWPRDRIVEWIEDWGH